jgi:hypothetical protein
MPLWNIADTNASKPKYLNSSDRNNNNANTYGVSALEQVSANNLYKPAHQGWVKVIPRYTDSSGQTRYKSETLVVMGDTITGNANNRISGSVNVSNGNVSISANITATTVASNTFALFTANVEGIISANDVITIGANPPRLVSAVSVANVTLNSAATLSVAGQKVFFTGRNTAVIGTSTRFTTELKVGDIIVVGNSDFQNVTVSVAAIANATHLTVNAAFANVNTGMAVYSRDLPWFAL